MELNPTVDPRDAKRLTGQKRKLVEALRQRPMTNWEIMRDLYIGNLTARTSELNAQGYDIRAERVQGGTWRYTLRGEP
jgi:hypothetical protein